MGYECVVVGGGAAGLAAAMVLARARRQVLLLDAHGQNNRRSSHSGGVFLHDGAAPAALYETALEQLRAYPTFTCRRDTVTGVLAEERGFRALTASGDAVRAQQLILAQGVEYAPSPVPGVDELWGTKVVHCPFCEGYECRQMQVLALGDSAWLEHMREILPNWVDDITWAEVSEVARLRDEGNLDGGSVAVAFADGREAVFDRVFAQQKLGPRDGLADSLGCRRIESGELEVDARGQTSVPGVFAAGDQVSGAQQVNLAVGSGHAAGMGAVFALSASRSAEGVRRGASL
jgi:thioredoxin reductase